MLEAAMTRALEEEDEFLQSVPKDETMKERQAEVYFQRNLDKLEVLGKRACCEPVSWKQAGFRFSVLLVCRAACLLLRTVVTFFRQ